MNAKQLEQAAIDAHQASTTWATFWAEHGNHVRALEPWHTQRFHALVQKLLGLVVAGDCDGQEPPPTIAPWELADDQPAPADVGTQARVDWARIGGC